MFRARTLLVYDKDQIVLSNNYSYVSLKVEPIEEKNSKRMNIMTLIKIVHLNRIANHTSK